MACRWVPLEHRQDLPPVLDLDTAIIQAYFGVLQDVASKFGDIPAEYSADFDAFCKVITRETSAEELQASKEAFAKVLDALAVTNSILDLSPAAKSCPRLSGAILVVPGIYIGSLATAKDKKLLTETGITHIVSCLQDTPFPDDFKYMHFAARDTEEQDISQFFDSTYQFINDALAAKGKVLVHCRAGVSRSPTIILAYLLRRLRIPLSNALSFLRLVRPTVSPNPGFLRQLRALEGQLGIVSE
eukprot:m.77937 g.77937  ORF g.77937 m.77937 type:complete len:244 (-) comp14090_c0_seq1:65-796(-)